MDRSSSSSCSVELTIISAENLHINGRLVEKNTFVTIEAGPNNSQSTSLNTEYGSYHSWNEKLELSLPHNVNHLRLYVKYKKASSVRTIGSVSIPLSDILEDYVPPNCLHFLSYRLRDHDGDRNGIVNLSIQVKGLEYITRTVPSTKVQTAYRNSINACGWKTPSRIHHQATYTNNNDGIAIGVPVPKR
ncbi:hypothetical protein ACHQM5_000786 [Ranunculus cassubicifolius]